MSEINFNAITSVTEDDMGRAWEAFDKMRNAVIEGSKLSAQFQELQTQVQALKGQVEYQIEANKRVDDMYVATRRQRDDAQTELASVRTELDTTKSALGTAKQSLDVAVAATTRLSDDKQRLMKERDDAQMSALEWEDKAEDFRKKLETVRSTLDGLTSALGIPNPSQATATFDQDKEDKPGEPPVTPSPLTSTASTSGDVPGGGSERPPQPRDPVTQQWRSPKEQEDWDREHTPHSY